MRDYSIYLKDIIINIDAVRSFISNMSYAEFVQDKKTNYSVVRCLEIIGEASKHIPATIRNKYPEVPWKAIAGTRNIIVHDYADVDLKEVWETVVSDLAPLREQIEKILSDR